MRTTKGAPIGAAIILAALLTAGWGSAADTPAASSAGAEASGAAPAATADGAQTGPSGTADPVSGTIEWKTDNPKHAERFGVDATCRWKSDHVAVTATVKSRIDRAATISLVHRYRGDGDWHGDSSGAEKEAELAAEQKTTWEVDAGRPDGVGAGAPIEECAPQITSVELGAAPTPPELTGPFRATTKAVTALVAAELGAGPTYYGEPRLVGVDCDKDRAACRIAYAADTPVFDPEGELLNETRPVWKKPFSDAKFEKASIRICGQTTTVGGKDAFDPVMRILCTRDANDQIDWDNVDAGGLKKLCDHTALVNFG